MAKFGGSVGNSAGIFRMNPGFVGNNVCHHCGAALVFDQKLIAFGAFGYYILEKLNPANWNVRILSTFLSSLFITIILYYEF